MFKEKHRAIEAAIESLNGRAPMALYFDGKKVEKLIDRHLEEEEQLTILAYGDWTGYKNCAYALPYERFSKFIIWEMLYDKYLKY